MRYYVLPVVDFGGIIGRAPKYTDPGALGAGWNVGVWSAMDYGDEAVMLVAMNLSPADHTTLIAQSDVTAIPTPISNTVGAGALATVKAKLEALRIPADWVLATMTYQQVIGVVIRVMQFMQRYQGIVHGRFFDLVDKNSALITLDTTFGNLTADEKTSLQNVATTLSLDTSGFTNASTMRQILKNAANQLYPGPIHFGVDDF